jgi:hypothetical protein
MLVSFGWGRNSNFERLNSSKRAIRNHLFSKSKFRPHERAARPRCASRRFGTNAVRRIHRQPTGPSGD